MEEWIPTGRALPVDRLDRMATLRAYAAPEACQQRRPIGQGGAPGPSAKAQRAQLLQRRERRSDQAQSTEICLEGIVSRVESRQTRPTKHSMLYGSWRSKCASPCAPATSAVLRRDAEALPDWAVCTRRDVPLWECCCVQAADGLSNDYHRDSCQRGPNSLGWGCGDAADRHVLLTTAGGQP